MADLRIKIAVPSHDLVPMGFAYDFASMVAHSTAVLLSNGIQAELGIATVIGTYIHSARERLLVQAIEEEATHILWIDSDMQFPKDALLRLLRRNKEMVGINYSTRGLPPHWVAIKSVEGREKLVTSPESTGLESVEAVGFGLVLMNVRRIAPKLWRRPWFKHEWPDPNDPDLHVGEDVYFCRELRKAGIITYVDHDLSKECGHIGSMTYRPSSVWAWDAKEVEVGVGPDN